MRSYVLPMTVLMITAAVNVASGEDFEKFNADDWKRYEAVQRVVASMPAALRRQHDFNHRDVAEIENDPTFKAWSALNPIAQVVEKDKIETRLAMTRPYRQAAAGGFWAFNNGYMGWNRNWNGSGYGCAYGAPFTSTAMLGGSDLW